ncbi:hypothetical protein CISIN_1g039660mg [Citrus sinensis]|uniref:Uncharacterized protein n=1 Tax=Citrus sinensis TaxID=2711 RepID=A0A067DHG7_CITSI|nr:hypothetical protein CISIN_1g039660mg [Citrus sinensis]
MPCTIYREGLPSSRDSREFYHMPRILDIYMYWKSVEYSKLFTSSNVLELPRSFRNWAKLTLLTLSWALGGQIGLAIWAVHNTKVTCLSRAQFLISSFFFISLICSFLTWGSPVTSFVVANDKYCLL